MVKMVFKPPGTQGVWLLVAVAALSSRASAGTALECPCEPQGHKATCSFMDLPAVPRCLPGDSVTQLYVNYNNMSELTAGQLQQFPLLRLFSAEGNHLTSLPHDLFRYNPRLRQVYLSENQINTVYPTTFISVPNLQKLVLSENRLPSLPPGTFRGLTKLLELDLSGNLLTNVPADAFPVSVRLIRLHNNRLESLPPDWPASLEEMDLSDNLLREAAAEPLQRLPALRELRLEGNPWHCSCQSAGALAELVQRKNYAADMEDQMLCSSPPELRNAQVLRALRDCYNSSSNSVAPVQTVVTKGSMIVVLPSSTTQAVAPVQTVVTKGRIIVVLPSSTTQAGVDLKATTAVSSVIMNDTTTASSLCPESTHAGDTLYSAVIILVVLSIGGVLVLLAWRIYMICLKHRFCLKQNAERLTAEDDESVV